MHRARTFVPMLAIASLALLASVAALPRSQAAPSAAQVAPPRVITIAPGVITQALSAGMPEAAPGRRLVLSRLTVEPGGIGPAHVHPGMTVAYVETGALGWTLLRCSATVTRADGTIEQVTEPGTEVVLGEGDAVTYDSYVAHGARGAADFPTVVLNARLVEADKPMIIPTNDEATPQP